LYNTQDLINILDAELRANWQGKRILLSSTDRLDNPVVAKAINPEKVSKVFAYQDFRRQIHEYQRKHHVSGIVWRECHFQGESITVPELHNQLIAIPEDKLTLMKAKQSILEFWFKVTAKMNYFLGKNRQLITPENLALLVQETEWAEVDTGQKEVYLSLCWGNPKETRCLWAKPQSGCHSIIAAYNHPSSISGI
jgi:hypothetical protein